MCIIFIKKIKNLENIFLIKGINKLNFFFFFGGFFNFFYNTFFIFIIKGAYEINNKLYDKGYIEFLGPYGIYKVIKQFSKNFYKFNFIYLNFLFLVLFILFFTIILFNHLSFSVI